MRTLSIRVVGVCASQGSKKHVGNGIMVESSKKLKPWRDDVRAALLQNGQPRAIFAGAVAVHFEFLIYRPKRLAKKNEPCVTTPDIDKVIRATMDAITSSGVWRDDSQVMELTATKRYAEPDEPTGCFLRIADPFPEFVKPAPKGKPNVAKKAAAQPGSDAGRPRKRAARPAKPSAAAPRRGPKLSGTDYFV